MPVSPSKEVLMKEKKILVVDDEEPIRKLFDTALKRKGFAVKSAASAEQALELIKSDTFKVMFLDLNLPGMNGIDLCKEILKKGTRFMKICSATNF